MPVSNKIFHFQSRFPRPPRKGQNYDNDYKCALYNRYIRHTYTLYNNQNKKKHNCVKNKGITKTKNQITLSRGSEIQENQ